MGKVIATPQFIDLEQPEVLRALFAHILDQADIVGEDPRGRTIMRFEFAAEPWLLDKLAAFDAQAADFEPEPLDDDEREEDRVRPVEPEYVSPRHLIAKRRRPGNRLGRRAPDRALG